MSDTSTLDKLVRVSSRFARSESVEFGFKPLQLELDDNLGSQKVSLLKQDKSKGSLSGKRNRAGWDESFLFHLLGSLAEN